MPAGPLRVRGLARQGPWGAGAARRPGAGQPRRRGRRLLRPVGRPAGHAGGPLRALGGRGLSSTKFLLFDGYFQEHPAVAPALASRSTPAAGPAGSEAEPGAPGDEPAVEEVAEMATLEAGSDPLAVYKKEEGEIFVERTKLFCFNAGEWQDAGAGEVHLLRRAEGRVRLLFQQEATKRIIANHFLVNKDGFCELQRHAGNDKAWVWTAQERVIERMFALRFKTVEQAAKFKDVFEEAKRSSPDARGDDYVVIRKVGVTVAPDVRSQHVRLLSVGETVRVGEVVYSATDQRVRGRLTRPAGWITIIHSAADVSQCCRCCQLCCEELRLGRLYCEVPWGLHCRLRLHWPWRILARVDACKIRCVRVGGCTD
ncbi:unnamed protein product [Prorocentrum cordatum]|uniref:RanBD1 domain-containing protein n=1 Tax=Prorocentrum cordatum TaxID=2364126 RepID=A0ABN9TLV9_9DINO|nr:unnamed protein product [Polarella glacialis]